MKDQYSIMSNYTELQVGRLKEKITRVENDLIKQQPSLFISSKERGKSSSDSLQGETAKMPVQRGVMIDKLSQIEVSQVINNFNLKREMKERLEKKRTIKFKEEHLNQFDIRERKEAQNDYRKCKINIRTS